MKKFISLVLVLVLLLTSSMAFAVKEVNRDDILLDTVALRPLGFIFFLFGCAVYTLTLPVAAMTDSTDNTYKTAC